MKRKNYFAIIIFQFLLLAFYHAYATDEQNTLAYDIAPPPLNFTETNQVIKLLLFLKANDDESNEIFRFIYRSNLDEVLSYKSLEEIKKFLMAHLDHPHKSCAKLEDGMKSLIQEILHQDFLHETEEITPKLKPGEINVADTSLAIPIFAGSGTQIGTGVLVSTAKGCIILTCAHIVVFLTRKSLVPYIKKGEVSYQLSDGRFPRGYLYPHMPKRSSYNYGIMFVPDFPNDHASLTNIDLWDGIGKYDLTNLHTEHNNIKGQTSCKIWPHVFDNSIVYYHSINLSNPMSGSPLILKKTDDKGDKFEIYGLSIHAAIHKPNLVCIITKKDVYELLSETKVETL